MAQGFILIEKNRLKEGLECEKPPKPTQLSHLLILSLKRPPMESS